MLVVSLLFGLARLLTCKQTKKKDRLAKQFIPNGFFELAILILRLNAEL